MNWNIKESLAYFRQLTINYQKQQQLPFGFARMHLDEILSAQLDRLFIKDFFLVLEPYEAANSGKGTGNHKQYALAFHVLRFVPDGDFEQRIDTLAEAEDLAEWCIAQMERDSDNNLIPNIESDFRMFEVNNILGGCYGYRVEFEMKKSHNLQARYPAPDILDHE